MSAYVESEHRKFLRAAAEQWEFLRTDEAFESFAQETLKDLAEADRLRPTAFEDVLTYRLMLNLANALKETAEELEWQMPAMPLFGTLPVGQFNAMAIRVPQTGEYIIAFQHGIFGFVNLVTKAVAAAFPERQVDDDPKEMVGFSMNLEDVDQALDADDEPVRRLFDFLIAYVIRGDPHAAEQYILGDPHRGLAELMLNAAEYFVFGHEFGHVIAGHLARDTGVERMVGDTTVQAIPVAWAQEFEADAIGLIMALATLERTEQVDLALSYCGIDAVLSAHELVTRAIATLSGLERPAVEATASHPPTSQRRAALRQGLQHIALDEQVQGAISLADRVEGAFDLMWRRIEPRFVRLHEEGVRPSSVWRG